MKFCIIFDTHGQDTAYNHRSGSKCKILKAIPLWKYDFFDIGFMYEIQFEDGEIIDSFSDELKIIKEV